MSTGASGDQAAARSPESDRNPRPKTLRKKTTSPATEANTNASRTAQAHQWSIPSLKASRREAMSTATTMTALYQSALHERQTFSCGIKRCFEAHLSPPEMRFIIPGAR